MRMNSDDKLHVAFIMDGNGRWAMKRGLPRSHGHRAGVETIRRLTDAAPALGIDVMTLYAFSADNWKRPEEEVSFLIGLLTRFLRTQVSKLVQNGMRLCFLGRRDRLPEALVSEMENAEKQTSGGKKLTIRVAIDYSSREAILEAFRQNIEASRDAISCHLSGGLPPRDVDLLIRTSGEQRLSDFLLWECAYAELYFTDLFWPDFSASDLDEALRVFHRRTRRFGGLNAA